MRIVTWNCCRGAWNRKVPLLDRLSPDVSVIQECSRPVEIPAQCVWLGDNPKQGLGVQVSNGYRIEQLPLISDSPEYVLPVRVRGPVEFVLIAVWAQHDRRNPYVEGVIRAVEAYEHLFRSAPVVLAGDLNSNAIWDKDHPTHLSHTSLVGRLFELGLVSSYHSARREEHGRESEPTFYFRWDRARPFHIDYCFIPVSWVAYLRTVDVGSYEDWSGHSDHRPLLVELGDGLQAINSLARD